MYPDSTVQCTVDCLATTENRCCIVRDQSLLTWWLLLESVTESLCMRCPAYLLAASVCTFILIYCHCWKMICFVNQTLFSFLSWGFWPEIKVSSCSVELMKCVVPTAPLFALALAFTFKFTINYWEHKTSKKRGRPIKMRHILLWRVDSEQQGGKKKVQLKDATWMLYFCAHCSPL